MTEPFGDSLRQIAWVNQFDWSPEQTQGLCYLSFQIVLASLKELGVSPNSLPALQSCIMYPIFLAGTWLLITRVYKDNQERATAVLFTLPLVLLKGYNSLQASLFGFFLVPIFVYFLVESTRNNKVITHAISLTLFFVIITSHPVNLVMVSIIAITTILLERKPTSKLAMIYLSLSLFNVLRLVSIQRIRYYLDQTTSHFVETITATVGQNSSILSMGKTLPIAICIAVGITSFIIIIRNRKENDSLMCISILFLATMLISTIGLSGIFLVKEMSRLLAYPYLFAILLSPVLFNRYLSRNKSTILLLTLIIIMYNISSEFIFHNNEWLLTR
jgi:hypothetical protein